MPASSFNMTRGLASPSPSPQPTPSVDMLVEITYSELKSLRDGSQLVPGTWYRITDYTCTCQTDDYDTQVAGHDFDIICLALDESTLSEECHAIQHDGDTYFANSNLNAWKVWYCLDNNKDRFFWADENDGKGVVWRLIDEWDNDVSYDFKNIQFYRDFDGVENYYYTFWKSDDDDNIIDDSLVVSVANYTGAFRNNLFGANNFDNILGASSYDNVFGSNCYSNTLGLACGPNVFGCECSGNILGDECYTFNLRDYSGSNIFGNRCRFISLGFGCSENVIGDECYIISLGDNSSNNTFDQTKKYVKCHVGESVIFKTFEFVEYPTGQNYEQYCGNNSSGVLQYWTTADLKNAANIGYDNTTSGLTSDNVQGAIDELGANLSELGSFVGGSELFVFKEIGLNWHTGEVSNYPKWETTDFIEIKDGYTIKTRVDPGTNFGIAFYDENKNYLYGTNEYNGQELKTHQIQTSVKYIRICNQYEKQQNPIVIQRLVSYKKNTKYFDKNVVLFGASFAYKDNGWFEHSADVLGFIPNNLAVSGTTIQYLAENATSIITQGLLNYSDAIVIMYTHNYDCYDGVDLKDDYTQYSNFNSLSSAASYDYVIKYIIDKCTQLGKRPNIYLCTHWHDGRATYNDSVRQLANKWGFPLVEFDKMTLSAITTHPTLKDSNNHELSVSIIDALTPPDHPSDIIQDITTDNSGCVSVNIGGTTKLLDAEVIDGKICAWHPNRRYKGGDRGLPKIQEIMANVFVDKLA